jgi:hypothetical protein
MPTSISTTRLTGQAANSKWACAGTYACIQRIMITRGSISDVHKPCEGQSPMMLSRECFTSPSSRPPALKVWVIYLLNHERPHVFGASPCRVEQNSSHDEENIRWTAVHGALLGTIACCQSPGLIVLAFKFLTILHSTLAVALCPGGDPCWLRSEPSARGKGLERRGSFLEV